MLAARHLANVPCSLYRPPVVGESDLIVGEQQLAMADRLMVPALPNGNPYQSHGLQSHRDGLQTFIFGEDKDDYLNNLAAVDEGWTLVDELTSRQYIIRGVDHYYAVGGMQSSDPYIHLRLEFVKIMDAQGDMTDAIHS